MRTLEDFKNGYGEYTLNGINLGDCATDLLMDMLGFCGCGSPEESLLYVKAGLQHIDDQRLIGHANWSERYKEWDAAVSETFQTTGARYFFWLWADAAELTEHGSSVPGWLTEKGAEFLSLLNEWAAHIAATPKDAP
jgi:hypothetical protein